MFRLVGLTLAVLGVLLAGCSKDDQAGSNGGMNHEGMNHEGMNHEGMNHETMNEGGMESGHAEAAALPAGANKVCPVTGDETDARIYVDYKGKRVYFCCDDCVKDFNRSPEEYFAKAYPDAGK